MTEQLLAADVACLAVHLWQGQNPEAVDHCNNHHKRVSRGTERHVMGTSGEGSAQIVRLALWVQLKEYVSS